MLAIVLLVLHGVGAWAYALLGIGAAMTAAALVVAVSIFSDRMAGKANDAWFVVPTVAFTAVPMAARLWTLFAVEQTWWVRVAEFGPFLVGFAAPVLLLLTVYLALGARRVRAHAKSAGELAAEISGPS